jgi:TonB family protein
MRGVSSAVSLVAHVGIVAAVIFGTAMPARSSPARRITVVMPLPQRPSVEHADGGLPGLGVSIQHVDIPTIPVPGPLLDRAGARPQTFPIQSFDVDGTGAADSVLVGLLARGPDVLTGPLPIYPELLRQAGVEGRVVLEATVDTLGRVEPASVVVVSATHPAFVAPARQALLATLFRPAQWGGQAVRMRVRIPFDFALRSGPRGAP